MTFTAHVTNYQEREERREAYIALINRYCACLDRERSMSFAPVDKKAMAIMEQP